MRKEKFAVTGMTCSACSSHVEKAVCKLEGIGKVSVNLLTNSMQAEYDEEALSEADIIAAVEKAGYGASPTMETENRERAAEGNSNRQAAVKAAEEESRQMKVRLTVSIVCLVPLMYVAMYHMFFEWFGLPIPGFMHMFFHGNENAVTFGFTQFLLVLPILYVNRKYFINGFRSLWHKSPNMDSLIAVGAAAAMFYGIFAIYRLSYGLGHGQADVVSHYAMDLYFESAGTILTLITVGKYLESKSKKKTSEAITKLMDLSPKTAIVERDGQEMEIPTELLAKGDIFLVKPGSLVPADGMIVEGSSSLDESAITGESIPVEKRKGDSVISATVNKNGHLKCEALRVGSDTTLSQIIRLVEEASSSKAPIAKLADKIAGVFVPVVMCIALAASLIWLFTGAGAEFAISIGIAVLVISCPCALGLATPVAIMVGTGVGAKNGILIKSGEGLQEAGNLDTVVLDKTGTITEGKPRVTDLFSYGKLGEQEILRLSASLERRSEHPLAEAVVEAARLSLTGGESEAAFPPGSLYEIEDFEAVFGRGIRGTAVGVQKDGQNAPSIKLLAGNEAMMEKNGVKLTKEQKERVESCALQGKTPLLLAADKTLIAVIAVADTVKESSAKAIHDLQEMGIEVIMLTGDNAVTAEAIRKQVGIKEVIAQVLPTQKEQKVSALKASGRKVAMVGDGINDAPALAAADVGIAIGAGTDVAIESADVILMKNDLQDVATAVKLSKAVIRNIKENLFWAFFYNSVGIPLAAGLLYPFFGLRLNPMFGAAAMSLSSICVVSNALRLRGFKPEKFHGGRRRNAEKKPLLEDSILSRDSGSEKEEIDMIKTISVEGMMCAHCVGHVQKALEALDGVARVQVSLEEKNAVVTLEKDVADEAIKAAVADAGYEVSVIN